jgi:hypothetical protein
MTDGDDKTRQGKAVSLPLFVSLADAEEDEASTLDSF